MSESAAGVMTAALSPWVARAAMRTPALPGEASEQGRRREHGEPGQEHAPTGQQVGDAAAEEQAAAGHEQVCGD